MLNFDSASDLFSNATDFLGGDLVPYTLALVLCLIDLVLTNNPLSYDNY